MVHDSLDDLKFDLRLQNRRGWVTPAEQEAHLESLPDVADKGEIVGDEPPAPEAPPAAAAPEAPAQDTGFGAPPAAEAPTAPAPPVTSSWGGNDNDH